MDVKIISLACLFSLFLATETIAGFNGPAEAAACRLAGQVAEGESETTVSIGEAGKRELDCLARLLARASLEPYRDELSAADRESFLAATEKRIANFLRAASELLADCKLVPSIGCAPGDGNLALAQINEILRLMIVQKDTGWAKPDPELVRALGFADDMRFYLKD